MLLSIVFFRMIQLNMTMTPLTIERHEKWEPVEGIVTAAARAVVSEDHEGLVVTMMFSEIRHEATSADLRIRFGRVAGYTVYEEFVHPWDSPQTGSPMIGESSAQYVFPLLLIHNSEWLRSLADHRLLGFPNCVHYRLLTLDQIVDVLSNKQPDVTWVNGMGS